MLADPDKDPSIQLKGTVGVAPYSIANSKTSNC